MSIPTGKICVKSKDPRINYNLVEGEVLMTCPYNLSHAVLPIKFSKHVLNCHKLHTKDQAAKGQQSLFRICQYNRGHHVRKEELAFHESNCESRVIPGKEDDWGWEDDASCSSASAVSFAKPGTSEALGKPFIPPPVVPKIDPEASARMSDDEWDKEPAYNKQFNADERLDELRRSGYKVVKYAVGLTKSERKKFYAEEDNKLAAYNRIHFVERVKRENSMGRSTARSSMVSSDSELDHGLMLPIREEN